MSFPSISGHQGSLLQRAKWDSTYSNSVLKLEPATLEKRASHVRSTLGQRWEMVEVWQRRIRSWVLASSQDETKEIVLNVLKEVGGFNLERKVDWHSLELSFKYMTLDMFSHDWTLNAIKWVFPKIVVPPNGWFIMENPIKMDDLEAPKCW